MDLFRVRLNCTDYYHTTPTEFDPPLPRDEGTSPHKESSKIPVIRVFGATESGQKVCAHIHGAFPYLYIRYEGSLATEDGKYISFLQIRTSAEWVTVETYIDRLQLSINRALAVSYRCNLYDGKTTFIAYITLVKGVPFYGYHVGYQFFLKIYMLNPQCMTRLADLLRQGTIMKKDIQPYESHMQYLAQWMCDYNLYGCAYIDCRTVRFRSPVPELSQLSGTKHKWHDHTIPSSLISSDEKLPRQSHCSIEVDVCVHDILNRHDITSRPLHHDFIERVHPKIAGEKLVHSMAGLWRDETRRRRARMGETGCSPFPPEVLVSVSANPRNSQPGGWIHEEEYLEKLRHVIKDEQAKSNGEELAFDTFVGKIPFETQIKTSLESVEDLFPDNLKHLKTSARSSRNLRQTVSNPTTRDADVDESRVLSFVEDDYPYGSDEEPASETAIYQREEGIQFGEHLNASKAHGTAEVVPENLGDSHHSRKLLALTPSQEAQGPTSSTELDALGIRTAGNFNHVEEDAFELPLEYASDTYLAIKRRERDEGPLVVSEPPLKRRQRVKYELSADPGDSRSDSEYRDICNSIAGPNGQTSVVLAGGSDSVHSLQEDNATPQQQISGEQYTTLKPSSQEGRAPNGLHRNRTLLFPIAKDPHDSGTILRLSQRINSPTKGSQKSKIKSVSFDMSGEIISKVSDVPDLPSFKQTMSPIVSSSQVLHISSQLHDEFNLSMTKSLMFFGQGPPSTSDIDLEMRQGRTPSIIFQDAYYSDEKDVPERPREYAGKEFKIGSSTVSYLPEFDSTGTSLACRGEKTSAVVDKLAEEKMYQNRRRACDYRIWEIEGPPPTRSEVQTWIEQRGGFDSGSAALSSSGIGISRAKEVFSQIDGATQKNRHGFKYSQKQNSTSVQHEAQYMSLMSLEIHINTRGSSVPNPEQDEISCVFWCIQSDDDELDTDGISQGTHVGVIALLKEDIANRKMSQQTAIEVEEQPNELDLINRIVDNVRSYDPDILTGYEVHGGSWGYVIERAKYKYDYDLCDELSRTKSDSRGGKGSDKWGYNQTSTIRVTGRHMINIWRAMRGELNLLQYTIENVVFHLLHRRIPHYSYQDLTTWYNNGKPKDLSKVIGYYISRVQLDLEILEQNELVPRTSEQARLLGVDFFSVFSRGSQFKVESLMFRIAKPENFLLPSPSRKQVGQQNALECLPLVMEPQSAFYSSPLLVLDFQSLYPSVMIAYNYCYSTFLGRVVSWRGRNKMGFTDYQRQERLLELLKDQINIAPNGVMYAKSEIRRSLLAKMLGEILETRVMVKSGMKVDKEDKTLQRLLNNRQLALKLIANVTYGYTSASFSGRMPCSEIADSIVQTSRETLEKSIALIHSVQKWGAEVVYGDTDSLFVHLKGRTKDEAFDIGNEIAAAITAMNPRPVKLKFEKVYFPCLLLAKKRYVGFKYESKTQKEPEFDAKGIETVRRDGTPAEQKIEEKALKIFFRTADLSQVKTYFQSQCTKIMKSKISIQDFCFAKEVKLGTYSDKGVPPPGALISMRRMLDDPRAEPQYGERVPYVVIAGAPGARLTDRCVAPEVLLHNDQNELDAEYYISKNLIPPLERIFNLVGANVRQWYDEMPKFQRIRRIDVGSLTGGSELVVLKKTLESYMKSSSCLVCREKVDEGMPICSTCMQNPHNSLLTLHSRFNKAEKKAIDVEKICRSCAGLSWGEEVKCESKDCAVFYTRLRHLTRLRNTRIVTESIIGVLEEVEGVALEW